MTEDFMSVRDRLEAVRDQQTFFEFARALAEEQRADAANEIGARASPYGPTAAGWENVSIDAFLESAVSWAEDSKRMGEEASWRGFAEFLYAGKVYESA